MRARGPVLKKDRHTVTTSSNPGETPAKPEVSGKKKQTNSVFTVFSGRRYFIAGLKGKLITCFWNDRSDKVRREEVWKPLSRGKDISRTACDSVVRGCRCIGLFGCDVTFFFFFFKAEIRSQTSLWIMGRLAV